MFLLESAQKDKEKGRYTFLGYEPYGEIIGYETGTIVKIGTETREYKEAFLDVLMRYIPTREMNDDIPFIGGAVGFVGYDVIRQHEYIGPSYKEGIGTPDAHMYLYDDVYIYDHVKETGYRYQNYICTEVVEKDFFQFECDETYEISSIQSNIAREVFLEKVNTIQQHIQKGDIFQLVLSQRFSLEFEGNTFSVYERLKKTNPSPYMYYLDFNDYQIIGTSPESLVSVQKGMVKTNPIAGTKPRGRNEQEDTEQEELLLHDEKELAEHYMLLDLGRNDVGRVCELGTVEVNRFLEIERYKSVMHLVSEVTGNLREGYTMGDVLKACLPAGTVSGAPKIRAMELINELEPNRRGIYSGAVGYFSVTGNMDMALAIRTIVTVNKQAYVQAGAGIVLDSIPQKEYEETIHKVRTLLEVLQGDFVN